MEFVAKGGVSQDKADVLADVLAEKITRMGDVKVVTKWDITSMLNLEKQKRLVGCTTTECVNEIGGALGIEWMVSGNVSLFGETYLLNLKLFDVKNADVPSRVTRKIKGGEDELLEELPEAAHELFEKAAARLQLIPTVTVASRRTQLLWESPSAVTVFTRKDIRNSGAVELADLLRRVPGFDVYQVKPGFPVVGARSMTTAGNNLILLLVDGREAVYEFTGFAFWNVLSIDMEEIERIEVIRGPGSALYGANAFAAVVSITTVADRQVGGTDIYTGAGETGQYHLFGRYRDAFNLGVGDLSFSVGLGLKGRVSPSDVRDDMAMENFRTHGYLRYQKGRQFDLSLHTGVSSGNGLFYVEIGDQRLTEALNFWTMGKAKFLFGEMATLKLQLYHAFTGGTFFYRTRFSAYDIWIADAPENTMLSNTVDGMVQFDWQITDNVLLISGGNLRFTNVGWEKVFLSRYVEWRGGAFLHVQWSPWDVLQMTGGMRIDLNTLTETAFSPRATAIYRPWKNHCFRLGYGVAFRKPSSYETNAHMTIEDYNPATPEIVEKMKTQFGNESLKNENVQSFEVGWRANFLDDRMRVSIDLFYNLYRDKIIFVIDIPTNLGMPNILESTLRLENAGADVNAVGGEIGFDGRLLDDLVFWCNLGLRHVTNSATGERMPSEPRLRANLGGRYKLDNGLLVDVALHYVSLYKMPLIDPENVLNNPEQVPLGENLLMICRIGYQLKPSKEQTLEGGLNVFTPLGSSFREYPGTPIPNWHRLRYMSDFGGEVLARMVSLYLRGRF